MQLIPALDLYNGNIVRLYQGSFDKMKIYDIQPEKIVLRLKEKGFEYLQLIDLEGAEKGYPAHLDLLGRLSEQGIRILYGGGLRTCDQIDEAFKHGANRIYSGSLILKNPEIAERIFNKWRDKVIPAIDIKNDRVVVSGWKQETSSEPERIFTDLQRKGFRRFLVTAVLRDGTQNGPDLSLYRRLQKAFPHIQLIAAGGVTSLSDISSLARAGCWAAVTGRAFLDNSIDISEARKVAADNA